MFPQTIKIDEIYMRAAFAAADEYHSKSRQIKKLVIFFGNAMAIAGDMSEEKANNLLEDLSTDGKSLYSDKIATIANKLLFLTNQYGMDIPDSNFQSLIGR